MIKRSKHGRGVFADKDYQPGETVEVCEVIFLPASETGEGTILYAYVYHYTDEVMAIALGNSSLYNHSLDSNVSFYFDHRTKQITFTAKQHISQGDELLISYTDDGTEPVTFLSKEKAKLARTGITKR